MKQDRQENDLIDLFEREPMEAREFIEAHDQWMKNPFNRLWFCFIYYRHLMLQWLGLR